MKKTVFAAIAALICLTACQESLEDRCAREAKNYTEKKCPAPIGDNITIDSVVFERFTHTMCYFYTLTGKADSREAVEKSNPRNALLQSIRNSTAVKAYKDAGYSFRYTYFSASKRGEILYTVTFKKGDYKS